MISLAVTAVLTLSPSAPQAPCADIDHQHKQLTTLLSAHTRDGAVDYAALKRDPAQLTRYLAGLEAACPEQYKKWSEQQRLAFWINAYNAYTIRAVLQNYPVASIRDIGGSSGEVWKRPFITLRAYRAEPMSLDHMEHQIIRKDYSEPRVHFALVCAAKSCPPLRNEAYRPKQLSAQLEAQAKAFLNDTSKNRYDAATNTLNLSPIFDWFKDDFLAKSTSLPAYVRTYLPAVPKEGAKVQLTEYNWSLNDWTRKGK